MKLLEDILVVDFSQFLSGPSASLRLADMGARVIKIERRDTGDICRQLYVSDVVVEGDSSIFHAINRNKQSYATDLKDVDDLIKVKKLIAQADVVMHNFRPAVMARFGLDYDSVKKINPAVVYAEVSGYGTEGPWKDLPGQDLLLQSLSGLLWLSHEAERDPTPMGVAVADILAGTHLTQGILAALYQRALTGLGALIQVNMLESVLDFQFEVFTCFLNDGHELPARSAINNAHAYVAAPYGVYKTTDGYLALAMASVVRLGELLSCDPLLNYINPADWFTKRDEIKRILVDHLYSDTTAHWLSILEPADIWCAKVMDYEAMMKEEGYQKINMEMEVMTARGHALTTTRCPLRVDGELLTSKIGAPSLGEHTLLIEKEFQL